MPCEQGVDRQRTEGSAAWSSAASRQRRLSTTPSSASPPARCAARPAPRRARPDGRGSLRSPTTPRLRPAGSAVRAPPTTSGTGCSTPAPAPSPAPPRARRTASGRGRAGTADRATQARTRWPARRRRRHGGHVILRARSFTEGYRAQIAESPERRDAVPHEREEEQRPDGHRRSPGGTDAVPSDSTPCHSVRTGRSHGRRPRSSTATPPGDGPDHRPQGAAAAWVAVAARS